MYFQIVVIMLSMIIAYVIIKLKYPVEWSLLAAAVAGGIVGTFFSTPPISELFRHLIEGTFTYMDIVLVFTTATIFMAIVKESGGVDYVIRATIKYFYNRRIIALLILMIIILIPGALTGAGSVSCLVVGAPVALALIYLGIPRVKVTAIIFILAGLSAAAPPVNIWAMITCAGTAIPYVGFELTLAIPILILGTFTILFLGYKKEGDMTFEQALKEMPEPVKGINIWKVSIPFIVFFGLVVAQRVWPFSMPILGLPLGFTISAIIAFILSPKKINILQLSSDTVKLLLPLLATVIIVGTLQQIMTVTGVRGMLSYTVITIPITLLFISLAFVLPISEGVLTYGAAALFGIPLTWYFDSIGLHATVVIAGMSLLYPLGDGLPPTALIGRLSIIVSDYKGKYWTFLKQTWVPWVVITVVGILMVVYSAQLSFLVEWSK